MAGEGGSDPPPSPQDHMQTSLASVGYLSALDSWTSKHSAYTLGTSLQFQTHLPRSQPLTGVSPCHIANAEYSKLRRR